MIEPIQSILHYSQIHFDIIEIQSDYKRNDGLW
jgi:hypothetical protein